MPDLLRRRADGFSEVCRVWADDVVVCIGTGPSLTQTQVDFVRGSRIIAINDAYLLAPWADVLYFADDKWFRWHTEGVAKPALGLSAQDARERFASFQGNRVTIDPTGGSIKDPAVHTLRNGGAEGLSVRSDTLRNGRNSGYQAINLAVLAGAKRILLLGYDGRLLNGKTHCHGGHPDKTHGGLYANNFRTMAGPLERLGVEVVNASPGSAIDAFARVPLDLVRWFECAPSA